MESQEQTTLTPPGRENHRICNKCGWAYPNPNPSAKNRRAHKKICGKSLGFKGIDSDDRTNSGFSDDEGQTPLAKSDVEKSLDVVGGVRASKSEDELFSDAVTEFSPADSEKSVERSGDSCVLLKADANAGGPLDSLSTLGTELSYVGLSDLLKVERAMENDPNSSPLLKVDASNGSIGRLNVGMAEVNAEDAKKLEKDEVGNILANLPEHLAKNLNGSFETEIKALETDRNNSPSREDRAAKSEREQGGESELKMSNLPLEDESIHQREENSAQIVDVSYTSDMEVSAYTKTEGEAVHVISVSENIPLVEDFDNLIEDFKDHPDLKSNIFLTLDSAEVVSSTNGNAQEGLVSNDQVKDNFALDTNVVSYGDLIEDSKIEGEGKEISSIQESDINLPEGYNTSEQDNLTNDLCEIHPNENTKVLVNDVDMDTSKSTNIIQTHLDSEKCKDEDDQEVVNVINIYNGGDILERVSSVPTESESVDRVEAQVSQMTISNQQKGAVEGSDGETLERISETPVMKEPSSGHLSEDPELSIVTHTAVEDSQNNEHVTSVGTTFESMQEKVKDGRSEDQSSVDLSSQNSLEANWGSTSVLSTQSDARASVDTDSLLISPQGHAKPEKANIKNSGHASDEDQVNQSETFEPTSTVSVLEQGVGLKDHQSDAFPESEAALNEDVKKLEERKKNEEVMAKHQSTPLKSLLGEADVEDKDTLTTTVKSVLNNEGPAKYTGSKKERKKVKGKPSWVPFACCSWVNVN